MNNGELLRQSNDGNVGGGSGGGDDGGEDPHADDFVRQWKESPFAVGYTKPTWTDEHATCGKICASCLSMDHSRQAYVQATACCCQCFPVGRVGNLVVLRQRMVEYEEEDSDDDHDDNNNTIDNNNNNNNNNDDVNSSNHFEEPTAAEHNPHMNGTGPTSSTPISQCGGDRRRRRRWRPKLVCVVGPYFVLTMTVTLPALTGLTMFTIYRTMWDKKGHDDDGEEEDDQIHPAVLATWAFCTFAMYGSLLKAACSDPGILYRYTRIPRLRSEEDDNHNNHNNNHRGALPQPQRLQHDAYYQWRWNDQALTYRPPGARFDPEVQAVVEQFDHTCPWVGTAIGKGNMGWFQKFLVFLTITVIYDIVLITYG
ncbi:hypothetical protein ACA910_015111 [Epithemia clementina (nom. ined.)]